MKMSLVMVMIYGGCGIAAAARMTAPGLLDSRVALIALFLMCSAHIGWRAFAPKRALSASNTPEVK